MSPIELFTERQKNYFHVQWLWRALDRTLIRKCVEQIRRILEPLFAEGEVIQIDYCAFEKQSKGIKDFTLHRGLQPKKLKFETTANRGMVLAYGDCCSKPALIETKLYKTLLLIIAAIGLFVIHFGVLHVSTWKFGRHRHSNSSRTKTVLKSIKAANEIECLSFQLIRMTRASSAQNQETSTEGICWGLDCDTSSWGWQWDFNKTTGTLLSSRTMRMSQIQQSASKFCIRRGNHSLRAQGLMCCTSERVR